ncbi:MAG: 7TM diverse intracellular signaling domain-containing protein [Ferruginibacter sp.]
MKKYFLLLFCFISWRTPTKAQTVPDSLVEEISIMNDSSSLQKKLFILTDNSGRSNINNLPAEDFIPLQVYRHNKSSLSALILHPFYLRFTCSNNSDKPVSFYFYPGLFYSRSEIYRATATGTPELIPKDETHGVFQLIRMNAGEKTQFTALLQSDRSGRNSINPQLINSEYLEKYRILQYDQGSDIKTVGFIFCGVLLMMVLFMGTSYLLNKRKEYLYNCLYSFCMFLLVLMYSLLSKKGSTLASFFYSYLDLVVLMAGLIFYIAFTRKFLNTKVNYPLLNKLFKVEELVLVGLLVFFSIIHFLTPYYKIEWAIGYVMKFIAIGLGIVYIVIAIRQKKNKLLYYLAAGNAFSIIFSSIALTLIILNIRPVNLWTSSLFYTELGIVLELIFFLYGLAYKNRSELIERTRMEEAIKLETEKQTFERQLAVLQAQQKERNRISADMHDDLGSGMTAIRLYSELAKKKITSPMPEIDKISSSADELINKMNAIIWTMSSSNDSLGNLVAYIRSYALEYLEDKGINCTINIDNKDPNLVVPGIIRRNVFLIVKETLNNILKHAKADKVEINYTETPGLLKLTIQDNGVGINKNSLREFGNGLKNMKERAESIGCNYFISNSNGTLTTLQYQYKEV